MRRNAPGAGLPVPCPVSASRRARRFWAVSGTGPLSLYSNQWTLETNGGLILTVRAMTTGFKK